METPPSKSPKNPPIQEGIENRIRTLHMFYIATKGRHLNLNKLMVDHFTNCSDTAKYNETKNQKNGNKTKS